MGKPSKNIQIASVAIVLMFALSFFQSTPLEKIFFKVQGVFLCLLLLFLSIYLASFSIKKRRIDGPVVYWLMIAAILPFRLLPSSSSLMLLSKSGRRNIEKTPR